SIQQAIQSLNQCLQYAQTTQALNQINQVVGQAQQQFNQLGQQQGQQQMSNRQYGQMGQQQNHLQ
ncbi:hypothetical protein SB782_34755, partial [Brevibacillus sp. SIMBA_076]